MDSKIIGGMKEQVIPFPDKKYGIIYADPPWQYHSKQTFKRGVLAFTALKKNTKLSLRKKCALGRLVKLLHIRRLTMLKIIDTEKVPGQKLYDIDETGTEMAVRAVPVEWIEMKKPVITCEHCDVWKTNGYLDGYGICLRTRTLEHKTHYCSAGQPGLTVEEET